MSQTDTSQSLQVTVAEDAYFAPGEVFFSRTDKRGVIQSGNAVFQRVSGYDWDALLGAPHKLVRHDDMPKAVFYLLWRTIQNGQPVGAYIKNRAQGGQHYWVFAVITPWQDRYLSARIKPTSARLADIEALYADIRSAERSQNMSAEDSARALEQKIQALGFDSYADFAAESLAAELVSEAQVVGRDPSRRILAGQRLLAHVDALSQTADALMPAFTGLTAVPRNLQIKASRLEPTGGPITALSSDYGRMSQEMTLAFKDKIIGANDNFDCIARRIKATLLYTGTREILLRCRTEVLKDAGQSEHFASDEERQTIEALIEHYSEVLSADLAQLDQEANRLSRACKEMRRSLLGLNTVRVTGKIENARLSGQGNELGEIIASLGQAQDLVEQKLDHTKQSIDAIAMAVRDSLSLERITTTEDGPPTSQPHRERRKRA